MTLTLDLPAAVSVDEQFLREAVAAMLYYTGKCSARQAREWLGISRRAFEELLPRYGYSMLIDSEANTQIELGA